MISIFSIIAGLQFSLLFKYVVGNEWKIIKYI